MTQHPEQFTGVQILRFVAAMLVVVMHTTHAISVYQTGRGYWEAGGSGVDIFFVISGFVMAITTQRLPDRGPARLAAAGIFFRRRILRIVPLYWFYTLLKAVLLLAVPTLATKSTFDTGLLAASLFFIPAMSPLGVVQPTLQAGWTLNFEMLFYLVFAIAIATGVPRIRFCLMVFLAFFLMGQHFPQSVPLAFYAQSIIFEFVLGVGIAYALTRFGSPGPALGVVAVLAGALVTFGIGWDGKGDRLMTYGLGGALIMLGTVWLEPWITRAPGARPLAFLGDASYSIYLVHTFVVPSCVMLLLRLGLHDPTLILLVVSLMVMGAGSLSLLWLEKPMTSFFKRFLFSKPSGAFPHATNTPAK